MNIRSSSLLAGALILMLASACAREAEPSPTKSTTPPPKQQPAPKPMPPAKSPGATKEAPKTDPKPDPKAPPAGTAQYSAADMKAAKAQLNTFCATCHGTTGKGNGAAAVALNPKPRDWTDAKWQDSVTDEKIFKVIKEGGAAAGLSPLMAPNLEFQDRPGAIHALVALVRQFKGK